MPPSRLLFSGHFFSSGNPLFQALFQFQRPHFYFSKNFAFSSPIFSLILAKFQLLRHTQTYSKNLFGRPQFQAKKSVPGTLLMKTWAAHTYKKKKKIEYLAPIMVCLQTNTFENLFLWNSYRNLMVCVLSAYLWKQTIQYPERELHHGLLVGGGGKTLPYKTDTGVKPRFSM